MKNKNKLKRCLDYITNNKDEIIKNYNDIQPSNKEIVLLSYLGELKKKLKETYTINFCEYFIDEYGMKKNICSSIRQIYFPFNEGNNYKEIYTLIKNYFTYEILLQKKIKTLLLASTHLVFSWKIADCLDLSCIIVSALRTKNYEAYVVCGEAPFSICSKDDKKYICEFTHKEYKKTQGENINAIDIREKKKKYKSVLNIYKGWINEDTFKDDTPEYENDFYVHMWILIKKSLDVDKDIFIEVSSGREYTIDICPYKSIFYLWNEKNVYININKVENIGILVSEIKNKEYFIPAFFEEIKNKALLPIIESKPYVIRKDIFLLKYPQGRKTTFFKNCKKDEYIDFLQYDGLTEMHTHYSNKFYTSVESVCSFYKHRRDKKIKKIYLPNKFKTIEYYDESNHHLLKRFANRIGFYLHFSFYLTRYDGLTNYIEIKNYKLIEYFINRNDNVIYRSMNISKDVKTTYKFKTFDGNEYYVTKITLKYRNKNQTNGIKKKVFLIPENKIVLVYYNNYNKISNIFQVYEKHIIYNTDIEKDEEVVLYKKNLIYKHFVNYGEPLENEPKYLINEERDVFEDMKNIYNIICSIMKEREEIKKTEDDYQYSTNNITNINEIIYHENSEIEFFNKNIMKDSLNIYNFYKDYPWNDYTQVSMKNTFFSSKNKMLEIELMRDEIKYISLENKINKYNK
ncbi:conserved Plasmodium protein, unknown function [Plasmodium berghei]|uniref:Dynein regulatory complex subunit 7 MORN domain-containing protein n=2 Tax=Plasmodium berghei TaxID=5821 RepID=A0A509ATJ1_PLABA|nr:conserved Plasmodium protein, unknown function [Plasmodium berghei ANKA]CXJ23987.1 conserved Plasmodium protein, unknown function [Plasmodium berghei]SCN28626.1 conserved Plasmodium protein, unknown function [Plasmodium berghei]SCO62826.1 conserved Plasmodium protein, unknown function [Plasmodium berghei]SCO64374.1 conserved Plasmodium protein, unknown function [Plasmodium berghei]VUC58507.1 conserved Plasmodium protein, unknown function [Plasmodium berghei ANKA]|eukprot:XP_034424270.1 conserved Plasmodium protein, unknown function [Plasmodium berghei ANKA]